MNNGVKYVPLKYAPHVVGMIGGMSVHSSQSMEKIIQRVFNDILGELHSADLITWTVNFHYIRQHMLNGNWDYLAEEMSRLAGSLVKIGATKVAIASNTMHQTAPQVINAIGEDHFIHIADCAAARCRQIGIKRVLFLGTKESMEGNFIRERLERHGLTFYVPYDAMEEIDEIIFNHLCHDVVQAEDLEFLAGHVLPEYIEEYNIEGVILGCTELSMLINERNCGRRLGAIAGYRNGILPFVDSMTEHARGIVKACLGLDPLLPNLDVDVAFRKLERAEKNTLAHSIVSVSNSNYGTTPKPYSF